MKKFICVIISLCLLINIFSVNVYASSGIHDNTDTTSKFKSIKERAINQNKVINLTEYETELKNAKSETERQKILKKYEKYYVEQVVLYHSVNDMSEHKQSLLNSPEISSLLISEGNTRTVLNYLYGATTTYDQKTGSDLGELSSLFINIVVGWKHPAIGAFMSILGYFIEPAEYESYDSVIIRTLHDYVVVNKEFQVYNGSAWVTMVTTQKKETNGQVNTVSYVDSIRYTHNKDLNIVQENIGNYYYNEATLTSQAINLYFSGSSPFVYYYYNGQTINYNNDSLYFVY